MSGSAIFVLLWAIAAIGMGAFFALRPFALERTASHLGQRIGYTERTGRLQVHLNRIAGLMFVIIGVVLVPLVIVGVLPPGGA
ncbi:hypothetical protein NQ152_00425 [Microbacterium sp. zg.B48]|uniref:hypothetical protein n=1 Tax=Microbacterium sp. zg.B48 TaxID=2969408 RepID=UPI00214CB674|nr:hypothetical protein [Microbacterium sp. zg.B48]MCR2761965.1 hypothetical protein [Microbacterium sp. zg.B48]